MSQLDARHNFLLDHVATRLNVPIDESVIHENQVCTYLCGIYLDIPNFRNKLFRKLLMPKSRIIWLPNFRSI